jgi:uncharacterized membrane protein required for colicin V production
MLTVYIPRGTTLEPHVIASGDPIPEVFPPDDPAARFVISMSMASNDIVTINVVESIVENAYNFFVGILGPKYGPRFVPFLGTLLVVTVLTVRISDMVLDSRVGALDRTLGFLFGLARGLLIVVVAYTFFDWLVPDRGKPGWILHAKSKVVLSSTGDWLKEQLPENAEATILKKLKRQRPEDTETPEPASPSIA